MMGRRAKTKHRTSSIEHRTSNVERATPSFELRMKKAFNVWRSTINGKRKTLLAPRPKAQSL